MIAQFSHTLDRNQTRVLFKLLRKYRPEDKKQKRERLASEAKMKAESTYRLKLRKKSRKTQTLSP